MDVRKIVSLWALLALMLGQVALAQHSASHIEHGFAQESLTLHNDHDNHQHQNDGGDTQHECPECLLAKSLQAALYNAPLILPIIRGEQTLAREQQSLTVAKTRGKANTPRAPPIVFI